MMETLLRKHKINIHDYPYQKDIETRLLMAEFSTFDVEVLEEILFSPLKIPLNKLSRSLEVPVDELMPVISKLAMTGLCDLQDEILVIDKDMRKYFEYEIRKFDEDFVPDMEYLQSLLKKVPIHILPLWYSIPRTSNNIFESIIEKYLLTPQIFQRHLMESGNDDEIFQAIVQDIFQADGFRIYADDIREKYDLTKEALEEYILHLEFHFIASLTYAKVGEVWKEVITPFREWRSYLLFLQDNKPKSFSKPDHKDDENFAFIKELTNFLKKEKKPDNPYFMEKLSQMKFIQKKEGKIALTEIASEWLEMDLKNKALFLHRYPLNRPSFDAEINTEKHLREIERSLKPFCQSGWIYFDEFLKTALIYFHEENKVMLKKVGKTWKYNLPTYTEEEISYIQKVIDFLYEIGFVSKGIKNNKLCFFITPLGQTILGN